MYLYFTNLEIYFCFVCVGLVIEWYIFLLAILTPIENFDIPRDVEYRLINSMTIMKNKTPHCQ